MASVNIHSIVSWTCWQPCKEIENKENLEKNIDGWKEEKLTWHTHCNVQ